MRLILEDGTQKGIVSLAEALASRGSFEVRQMRWSDAADSVAEVYDRLLHDQVAA